MEAIVLGGLDFQYCSMDSYVLSEQIITTETKWELTKVTKVKSENANNLESTVKLASKNLITAKKDIMALDQNLSVMSEELAQWKYKHRKLTEEVEEKHQVFRDQARAYRQTNEEMKEKQKVAETKQEDILSMITLEQKMQDLQIRKIDHIQKSFASSENFLINLDTFMSKLKTKLDATQNGGSDIDLSFLET